MKKCLNSSKFKNAVKMCLCCSVIVAFFLKMGFHEFYDYIFPIIFLFLTIKYFTIKE